MHGDSYNCYNRLYYRGIWNQITNSKMDDYQWCFSKRKKWPLFRFQSAKNAPIFCWFTLVTHLVHWFLTINLYSAFFFKKFQKYLVWTFQKYDIFWHNKLRFQGWFWIIVFFCETKVVSRWFQILKFETTLPSGWFQAILEVFFFLGKVSMPKNDRFLA